ncbi:hypothetical protein GCM10010922_27910 [Microbacterium sorbitolivorans]|uniref:Amino acid transporter n=1 Tax=Microbacterium sorbitolivorans TaxID=1867410 RepID=A0A367XT60_9MICO|nr:amino acid transporter [Microbacterium sorbitolivorans]RCK56764.1 amino acid transporter [Microbacterium sorbitolivorans]GGF50398.1 hypothetical protein GCM10010922_27910 [Microbacterium sorbitolivorans]
MTEKNTTRRDLMKPLQLLGWSFGAAIFAGFVTAMSMGAFTQAGTDIVGTAWRVSAIVAGITFIVVVLCLALLLLVVDPSDLEKEHDKGVLLPEDPEDDKK